MCSMWLLPEVRCRQEQEGKYCRYTWVLTCLETHQTWPPVLSDSIFSPHVCHSFATLCTRKNLLVANALWFTTLFSQNHWWDTRFLVLFALPRTNQWRLPRSPCILMWLSQKDFLCELYLNRFLSEVMKHLCGYLGRNPPDKEENLCKGPELLWVVFSLTPQ